MNARDDALAIWSAGVEAVRPSNLVAATVRLSDNTLHIRDQEFDLRGVKRIVIVGAGKASAELAVAFEQHVISPLLKRRPEISVSGWINCPAATRPVQHQTTYIRLFEARPAGLNVPTAEAVGGTKQILELVSGCGSEDLVICLLSGGGSALLVAPVAGVSLEDKQAVAKLVAAAGANIEQLNCVRRALSQVKGGGLARACNAPQMHTLIVSDVLGDSLQTIASGPTVVEASVDPEAALDVLSNLNLLNDRRLDSVIHSLRNRETQTSQASKCHVENIILGNNADAVDAAGVKAVELGYRYVMECARECEGDALAVAQNAAKATMQLATQDAVDCWISGGEPTVRLPENPGKGGRNQQLALATLRELNELGWPKDLSDSRELAFVSGGTDGEDGPTNAAGGFFDQSIASKLLEDQERLDAAIENADAFPLLEAAGGLLLTGATGTNVCDLRVAVCPRHQA